MPENEKQRRFTISITHLQGYNRVENHVFMSKSTRENCKQNDWCHHTIQWPSQKETLGSSILPILGFQTKLSIGNQMILLYTVELKVTLKAIGKQQTIVDF